MTEQTRLAQARRQGRLAAERLRNRLGLGDTTWVDVYEVIESLPGIELLFRPLKGLYGFYLPAESEAGIVVNAKHPSSLRRFTAAHELGHHVLGHGESVDEIRDIEGALGVEGAEDVDERIVARSSAVADGHDGERLGASETRHLRFAARSPGLGVVRLGLRPAWLPDSEPVESRVVEVDVREPVFDYGCALSRRTLSRRVSMAQAALTE